MQLHNKVNNEELKARLEQSGELRKTLSFYRYHQISHPAQFRDDLYLKLFHLEVYGRIYIASEGINGQISVPEERYDDFVRELYTIDFLNGVRLNEAVDDDGKSFYKLKIKVRDKIVADGLDDSSFDVTRRGEHLDAVQFNELTRREDTIVIDMRNHYESEVGHFESAICPDVETFREALPIVEDLLQEHREKHIIMYCTGGIRCEKASAYFKHKGFDKVYQLNGGIIEYARTVQELGLENKFLGKNFVFDERLGERISQEIIAHCHQCGTACDDHTNCANDACHILFIQCEKCKDRYEGCCSEKCKKFNALPEDERNELRKTMVFNGTINGKGRYKAKRKDQELTKSEA
ncbi:MAG TPA: rhodanese-related sulfurtransferase [Saprospiraceae bacterium]|nr:rhodanese-related sulfurtransferase [Saprospiraceae bacterium]